MQKIQNGFTKEMQTYFDTLPPLVQESIMQSGMPMGSLEQLKETTDRLVTEGLSSVEKDKR